MFIVKIIRLMLAKPINSLPGVPEKTCWKVYPLSLSTTKGLKVLFVSWSSTFPDLSLKEILPVIKEIFTVSSLVDSCANFASLVTLKGTAGVNPGITQRLSIWGIVFSGEACTLTIRLLITFISMVLAAPALG